MMLTRDRRNRGRAWLAAAGLVVATLVACGGTKGSGFPPNENGGSGGGSGGASGSGGSGGGSSGGSSGGGGSSGSGFDIDGGDYDGPSVVGDSGCAKASASATRAPVYMLFVEDGSGSMGQDNKWTAVVPALEGLFASFENDPGIAAGLIVFADTMDMTLNTGPGPYPEPGIDVPMGYVSTAQDMALNTRLSGMPNSNTPTYYALQGGYGELESFMSMPPLQPNGQKVLVLITDGVPTDHNCSISHAGTNYPMNPCVLMAGAEHAKTAPAGPIVTFVIGVGPFPNTGTDFDPAFLGNLAQAGGGAPAGCNPNETQNVANVCFFEVDPTQAASAAALQMTFTDALQAIRGQVLSCTFPLQTTGLGMIDPTQVNVDVDGMTVPQSPTNGWTYDNPSSPTAIVFNGSACNALKNDPNAKVSIVIGCATIMAR
jgi:hypothetical protein